MSAGRRRWAEGAQDEASARASGARCLLVRGSEDEGRRARSLLYTARCLAQPPRNASRLRRARAPLLLPRRAPRLSFYILLPAPSVPSRTVRAPAPRHTAHAGVAIPRPGTPHHRTPVGSLRPCPAPRRHWPSPACPCPDGGGGPGRQGHTSVSGMANELTSLSQGGRG